MREVTIQQAIQLVRDDLQKETWYWLTSKSKIHSLSRSLRPFGVWKRFPTIAR